MLRSYLKIWEWDLIFGRAVKAIFSPGVQIPCLMSQVSSPQSLNATTHDKTRGRNFGDGQLTHIQTDRHADISLQTVHMTKTNF